ncbi:MAG: hypothetical protein WCT05_10845 [Lentisphaeria bacterium]
MSNDLGAWRDELLQCVKAGTFPPRPAHLFTVQPVLIVAGACRNESGEPWRQFIKTLEDKLSTFAGRVISGGTCVGVCAEVGRISAETSKEKRKWISVGYLPGRTSPDWIDKRYDEFIFTDGNTFSEMEPLQYWTDILASGISPEQVFFLRYGGSKLSDFEEDLMNEIGLPRNAL